MADGLKRALAAWLPWPGIILALERRPPAYCTLIHFLVVQDVQRSHLVPLSDTNLRTLGTVMMQMDELPLHKRVRFSSPAISQWGDALR